MRVVIFFGLLAFGYQTFAQQEPHDILQQISKLQTESDPFYDRGLFPSQRDWIVPGERVEDNNVLVTASVVYLLKDLKTKVDPKSQKLIEEMAEKAIPAFENYYSRKKQPAYNFWKTAGADLPFPNGGPLMEKRKYRLPDDYDNTCMILLAQKQSAQLDKKAREYMVNYANRQDRRPTEVTLDKYRDRPVYEVFFVDKMDQMLDVCVMANVLLFVIDRNYELKEIDRSTIEFLKEVIRKNDHWNHPEKMSPNYRTRVWILYHLSRLMAKDVNGWFDSVKPDIINDLYTCLADDDLSEMEKVLLASSLMKLGKSTGIAPITFDDIKGELDSFMFYGAKIKSWLPLMTWHSRAMNLALYYEYLVWAEMSK